MSDKTTLTVTAAQKPAILAALYNNSKPQGMGILHYTPEEMTEGEAATLLQEAEAYRSYFDYLKGRVMKMDFSGDELDFRLYDRDNGQGAGMRAALTAVKA